MADKKSIVIKVKYPTAGKISEHDNAPPKTITEWNIKRIAVAAACFFLIFAASFYLVNENSPDNAPEKPESVALETKTDVSSHPDGSAIDHIQRSLLAYKIVNNEPVDEITPPVKLSKKNSTWVYYFVELKAMKGKTVYHEWLLNGKLISRKKVNVSDDPWRTASRQVFTYTSENNWTVRLVDDTGAVISEKRFDVIYE